MQQRFIPGFTPWHITFGTYGTRLHGSHRPTVDRQHNQRGTPFLASDAQRQQAAQACMKNPARWFTAQQRAYVEDCLPALCERGGWGYRIAASEDDHIHLLCDVPIAVHGKQVRRLVKRWLRQELSECWPLTADERWWAVGGSNIAVREQAYLENVYRYVLKQRFTAMALEGR